MPSMTHTEAAANARHTLERQFQQLEPSLGHEQYWAMVQGVVADMAKQEIFTSESRIHNLLGGVNLRTQKPELLRAVVSGMEAWRQQNPSVALDTGAMMDQVALLPEMARGR